MRSDEFIIKIILSSFFDHLWLSVGHNMFEQATSKRTIDRVIFILVFVVCRSYYGVTWLFYVCVCVAVMLSLKWFIHFILAWQNEWGAYANDSKLDRYDREGTIEEVFRLNNYIGNGGLDILYGVSLIWYI